MNGRQKKKAEESTTKTNQDNILIMSYTGATHAKYAAVWSIGARTVRLLPVKRLHLSSGTVSWLTGPCKGGQRVAATGRGKTNTDTGDLPLQCAQRLQPQATSYFHGHPGTYNALQNSVGMVKRRLTLNECFSLSENNPRDCLFLCLFVCLFGGCCF